MNTQDLFNNFTNQSSAKEKDIIQFINNSPFTEDYWKDWKKLFKLTEEALREVQNWDDPASHQLLTLMVHFLIRLDQQDTLALQGKFPTKLTMRYMKRRGRRLMWFLAKNTPHLYRVVAEKLLMFHELHVQPKVRSLDYKNHWLTLDVLLGKSRRCEQLGHGQGAYKLETSRYHLHHREEGVSEVWDVEFDFLKKLLTKNLPWQVYEFAVKVLERNNQSFGELSNDILTTFFESPSLWLKRIAVRYIDSKSSKMTFSPELIATRWFFGNFNITQIKRSNQPKLVDWVANFLGLDGSEKGWYKKFKKKLRELVMKGLAAGDTSKRMVRVIEFLQAQGGFHIEKSEVYGLAETLFKIDLDLTRGIAFKAARKADTYHAAYWLNAARHSEIHLQQLLEVYRKKMDSTYRYWGGYQEFVGFMFVEHPDVVDFGWEMAERYLRVREVTEIWGRLVRSRKPNAAELLKLNVQSQHGVRWFTASHANQMDHLYAYSAQKISFMLVHALPPIRDLLLSQITHSFEFNPLLFLYLVANLPHKHRKSILEKCMPKFKKQDVLFDVLADNEMLPHILQRLSDNTWGMNAFLNIVTHSKLEQDTVDVFVEEMLKEVQHTRLLITFLNKLGHDFSNQDLFVQALAQHPLTLLKYNHLIPKDFWVDFLLQIPEEHLEKFKEVFMRMALTLGNEILKITHPALESVLIYWLNNNRQSIDYQSNTLFEVCIHRLPKVRSWGFDQVNQLGTDAGFALRLLESEMPDAVNFAQAYFNRTFNREDTLVEDLLTLCDSPVTTTRDFGLELLQNVTLDHKKHSQLLAYLSEHADGKVQEYVSEKLLVSEATPKPFVKTFDRSILRRKNQNKVARENVKKRWSQQTEVDVETLLELAKTGNKKDSEWAIFQLTKLSLQGQDIEGFALE